MTAAERVWVCVRRGERRGVTEEEWEQCRYAPRQEFVELREVDMAERTERAVLNHLIETCRDAERGFRTAAEHVANPEVKRTFLRLAQQRHEFAEELLPHAYRLGGAADADGTGMATMHRTWMQVRARLAANPERAIVEEAVRGERYARSVYDEAVQDVLPPDVRDIVEAQDLDVRVAGRMVAEFVAQ
jgi:uncharacterized protein (TIGR02284 family)